jgi:hypothetical protein
MRTRVLFVVCALASGCLSTAHEIPHDDLVALARTAPAERAEHVRVIQSWSSSEAPPAAPHVGVVVVDPAPVSGPPVGRPAPFSTAKTQKQDAKWWIILAAATGVVLAATEGVRWDGWVAMHPDQPVHLFGPDGAYTWLPLSQLDLETASWAQKAVVREDEGPPWTRLERAPLDRRGGTYSVLLGAGDIVAADHSSRVGFLAHIELGYAPLHTLAALLDLGLGWSDDPAGATVFESRTALELQLFLPARIIHPGVYGELGMGFRKEDLMPGTDNGATLYAAAGGILQLELTARLALTVRAGAASVYGQVGSELVGGISIY